MSPSPLLVHGALLLVSLIFGLNYVAVKLILEQVPAATWMAVRIGLATVLLVPIAALTTRRRLPREALRWLLLAAFLGVGLNQILFAEGMARTDSGHASLINAGIPLFTLFFAVLARQEAFTPAKLLAIATALAGVLVLLRADRILLGEAGGIDRERVLGDLLVLGNATSFSAFLVVMRHLGRSVDPLRSTAFCFFFGGLMMVPWVWGDVTAATLDLTLRPGVWPIVVFAVVGATVITYLLNGWALRHTHSSQVALYIYVQPVVATAVSFLLGRERPDLRFFLAAGLVCSGILVQQLPALLRRGA